MYSSSSSVPRRMKFAIYLSALFGVMLGALLGYLRHPFLGATIPLLLFFVVVERVAGSESHPRVTAEDRFLMTLGLLQDRTDGEPVSPGEVVHVMGVDLDTLAPLISQAEVKGEITVDAENGLSLTNQGRQRYDRRVTPQIAAAGEADASKLDIGIG